MKLTSCGKFGFSRPDIDGNKLVKGMCLARKARDREIILIVLRVVNYFFFDFITLIVVERVVYGLPVYVRITALQMR